jgi:heavy metal sensor kinase
VKSATGRGLLGPWWRSHSVRMRLTLWYVGAMVVVLAVYVAVVTAFVSRSLSQSLDQRLRGDFYWAAATVDETPQGTIAGMQEDATLLEDDLPWLQVWSADGRVLLFANSEARRRPLPESQQLAVEALERIVPVAAANAPVRVLSRRSYIGDQPIIIQVARSEGSMEQALSDLVLILVLGLPVAVAVAGLGGYVLARGALAPIEEMTERARSITADRLADRLPVDNPDDEMGRLAVVFNETLGRLQQSFDQMRRFTADVSHELRTPLTAIRSVGEVGLRGHRDEAAYRGIIGSMLEEADRLAGLVNRLLTLSRAETGQAPLSKERVNAEQLAEDVAGHLGVLAEEKRQSIVIEGLATSEALADRLVLRQALINLADNAIKFSPEGGSVRIRISETPTMVVFDVIDSGPGIAPEARSRIFDRFYRVSGVAETGTGLGLSLAKGAVEASGGRLTLEATGAEGSTFRIVMPRVVQRRRRAG